MSKIGKMCLVVGSVIEKCKLPPIQIFDKNCPLKRANQKFAIFRQNVRKLELFWQYLTTNTRLLMH